MKWEEGVGKETGQTEIERERVMVKRGGRGRWGEKGEWGREEMELGDQYWYMIS